MAHSTNLITLPLGGQVVVTATPPVHQQVFRTIHETEVDKQVASDEKMVLTAFDDKFLRYTADEYTGQVVGTPVDSSFTVNTLLDMENQVSCSYFS